MLGDKSKYNDFPFIVTKKCVADSDFDIFTITEKMSRILLSRDGQYYSPVYNIRYTGWRKNYLMNAKAPIIVDPIINAEDPLIVNRLKKKKLYSDAISVSDFISLNEKIKKNPAYMVPPKGLSDLLNNINK